MCSSDLLKAVEYVTTSPLFAGLECHLLMGGDASADLRRKLDEADARLQSAGFTVKSFVAPGEPEAAIAAHVDSQKIGLLVMGAYGHSRIRSLIIGSTTTEMIRSCKVPVVLFR